MSLPQQSDLTGMDVSGNGAPFVRIVAKTTVYTDGLDISDNGPPWWCTSGVYATYRTIWGKSITTIKTLAGKVVDTIVTFWGR